MFSLEIAIIIILVSLILAFAVYWSKKPAVMDVQLLEKTQQEKNAQSYTFMLPRNKNNYRFRVCQQVYFRLNKNGRQIVAKQYPIQKTPGTFKLFINKDTSKNQNTISKLVSQLKIDDKLSITVPWGKFQYIGNCFFRRTTYENKTFRQRFKNVFLIASGDRITPAYHFLHYITFFESASKRPDSSLIVFDDSQGEIMLKQHIEILKDTNPKLEYEFVIQKPRKNRQSMFQGSNLALQDKICQRLDKLSVKDTYFLISCEMIDKLIVQKILKKLKIDGRQIHTL